MTTESQLSEIPADQDPRWAAVAARDRAFDGKFYYSVGTTGVYCRPSCAARLAKPGNVRFHATRADAEKAGFRPCKRCKPDQPSLVEQHAAKVAAACRLIASADEIAALEELARAAGLSPQHSYSKPSPASPPGPMRWPIVPSASGRNSRGAAQW